MNKMATASVRKTPKCPLCCEIFTVPKILPCGHTFCLDCIEVNISDKGDTFFCVICRQHAKIPEGGAKMIITNLVLVPPPPVRPVEDQPSSTEYPKCPNHSETTVDYYCKSCNLAICFECSKNTEHKDHKTVEIDCEQTRIDALKEINRSKNVIQNKLKELEMIQEALVDASANLKIMRDEACAEVTERTENAIAELRERHDIKRHNGKPFGR